MSPEWVLVVLTAVSMVVGTVISAITTSWILSSKLSNRPTFHQVKEGLGEVTERVHRDSDNYGEALRAVRTKIEQFELWVRDHLAEKQALKNLETDVRGLNQKLEVLSPITVKVDTMWTFMMDRGGVEAMMRGYMRRESPLALTDEGKKLIAPLIPEIRQFCLDHPEVITLPISDLEFKLANQFRDRLIAEICEPNHIYMGACIVMMMEALRLEKIIPTLAA